MPGNIALTFEDQGVAIGTHALVIGVGDYPHLIGGVGPLSSDADGMGQLSSPPISAREFANWLQTEYRSPEKPLATLALLLSEPGQVQGTALANSINAVDAVREWKGRASADPANRLIFYFCGHGISQGDDMSLLLSDYGADEDNPLNGALDFRQLVGGLKKCAANEQAFFIDACRASTDTMIERGGGFAGTVPLLPGSRPPAFGPQLAATYYATLSGALSHARFNQVSLFTGALIKSLRGAGSDEVHDNDWRVITGRLQDALSHFLMEPSFAGKIAKTQVPNANVTSFELHKISGLPSVPVYVGCQTADENARAQFVCRLDGQEQQRREPDGDDSVWVVELASGRYEFVAALSPDDIRITEQNVRPMCRRLTLEAKP